MTRFTGFREDPRRPIGAVVGSAIRNRFSVGAAPRTFSLMNWSRPQQQYANDCVLQTARQMAYMWCGFRGIDIPDLSSYFGYWATRRHVWQRDEIMDLGSYPTSMQWAVKRFGLCREVDWTSTSAFDASREPPSYFWPLGRKYRLDIRTIYDSGQRLVERVRDSIAKGFPVGLALRVDDAFLEDRGPSIIGPTNDATALNHMVTAGAYEPSHIGIVNSWGPTWREGGRAWITEEYLMRAMHVCYLKEVMIRG